MWAAREQDGTLWVYDEMPTFENGCFIGHKNNRFSYRIPFTDVLPDVTFENSPVQIIPYGQLRAPGDRDTEIKFNEVIQVWKDYSSWFVFSEDGFVSCRLCIWIDNPKEAVISDLYVLNGLRKHGYATSILDYCRKLAKQLKCDTISLRSDHDDWVRQWYMRLGFEVESSQVWLKKDI